MGGIGVEQHVGILPLEQVLGKHRRVAAQFSEHAGIGFHILGVAVLEEVFRGRRNELTLVVPLAPARSKQGPPTDSFPTQGSSHSPAIEVIETHGLIAVQHLEEAHRGTQFRFVRPLMFPRHIGIELSEPRHRVGLGNAQKIGSRPGIIRPVFVADGGFERRSLGIIPSHHGARPRLPESIDRGIKVLALPTVTHLPTESAAPGPSEGRLSGQGMDLGTHRTLTVGQRRGVENLIGVEVLTHKARAPSGWSLVPILAIS